MEVLAETSLDGFPLLAESVEAAAAADRADGLDYTVRAMLRGFRTLGGGAGS